LKGWVDEISWLDQDASIYQYVGPNASNCQVVPKWNFQPQIAAGDNKAPTKEHGISLRHHIANRAGNIPDFMPAITEPLEKMCIRPFRAMTVNWRGDVILCCNDYHAEASVGNVMDKSLEELWNDPRYHAYRIKLQKKDRRIHLCDVCDYNGGFYQHNVPHVTLGAERDAEILAADLRSADDAGFAPLISLVRS
jgi:radical SAM protein with 4Fe4S-binding SPASM domain